jgi:hypothetical protein
MNPGMVQPIGWKRMIARPRSVLLIGFLLSIIPSRALASDETIPPGGWIYPALRTFEMRGLVTLEPSIPYSRSRVASYLERILSRIDDGEIVLTARQEFLLGRLRDEFRGRDSRPREREDRPLYVYGGDGTFVAVDMTAGAAVRKRIEREKGQADGLLVPGVLIDLGGRATLESNYRVRIEPERGSYRSKERPSARTRSWRGTVMEYERGYISLHGGSWRAQIGRDYVHWGSGRRESLILSQTAGSLDHVAASFRIGRFGVQTVHAALDPTMPRYLAAHRVTVRLPGRVYLGISESVVYTGRSLDFTYLVPVVSYYSNQYNERGDDNVLWGFDVKVPLRGALVLYGELLIDDLQYESDPPAPHRLAYDLTAEALFTPWGRDVEVRGGYTFVDIFTYAHRDSLVTRYVAGDGAYPGNPILGSPLGPDADRWRFEVRAAVHRRVTVGVETESVRRGEGNGLREWKRYAEDPDPAFPSGVVTRENRYGASCAVDLGGGSVIAAGGGWIDRSRDDADEREPFAFLEVVLDF